jgi:hypothetical protein
MLALFGHHGAQVRRAGNEYGPQSLQWSAPAGARRISYFVLGGVGNPDSTPASEAGGRAVSLTATVTATTTVASSLRQPSTANYSRTFDLTRASATFWKADGPLHVHVTE